MNSVDLRALNDQFSIPGHVNFIAGPDDIPLAEIRNSYAAATVSLHAGQVLRFQPHGAAPVLFLSNRARLARGESIRGGIPVCWPWFGPHPSDPTKPQHGFVRKMPWGVRSAAATGEGETELRLEIGDNDATYRFWPYRFDLRLIVTVGASLAVELMTRNTGDQPFSITGALHTYFNIGDIEDTEVLGLDGCAYLDKTEGYARKEQRGPVTFSGETDRVYLDTTADCVIDDRRANRRIRVAKSGSRTTVVWNPWLEKAQALDDMEAGEYRRMVCVETANAAEDVITLAPGEIHRLRAVLSVEEYGA